MDRKDTRLQRTFFAVVLAAVVVASIIFARPVLMPLALGVVLAFAIAPIVRMLEQLRVPTVWAVVVVVTGFSLAAAGVALRVGQQFGVLLQELPGYTGTLKSRISSFGLAQNPTFDGLWRMYDEISSTIQQQGGAKSATGETEPVIVQEVANGSWAWQLFQTVLQPTGVLVIVVVLIIFLLIERVQLRDRVLAVAGTDRIAGSTRVLSEVGDRLGRYLFWLCVTNFSFAVLVGAALVALGIPYVLTWATLTGLLRFVPFVGSPLSMLLPVLMALVSQPGWSAPLAVAAVYVVLEFASNNYVEPCLIGRSIGLNTIGVIMAVLFWSWAWGATGLVLALPLTLTCVVFGKHVRGLAWLNTLFGIEPPLSGRHSLYQRLIAGDAAVAAGMLKTGESQMEWAVSLDDALAPALVLARNDFATGSIDEKEFAAALATARQISEESQARLKDPAIPPLAPNPGRVNVVAPSTLADTSLPGIVLPFLTPWCQPVLLEPDRLPDPSTGKAELHIVCVLPQQSLDQCLELCERIREEDRTGRIIIFFWKPLSSAWKLRNWFRRRTDGRVHLATGLRG